MQDVYKVACVFLYKMVRKNTSAADCYANLETVKNTLPPKLAKACPTSWYKWLQLVEEQSGFHFPPSVEYDLCPADCVVFRGDLESVVQCPHCKMPRYLPGTTKPQRRFHHLPLAPRIRMMFASPAWSKLLEAASSRPAQPDNHISDIHDGLLMRGLYKSALFANNKYSISMLIGCDGADARKGKKSEAHSVHPVVCVILVFSAELRYSFDFVLCAGVVPGPGINNLEVCLRIIVDEVEGSFRSGFQVYDALADEWHLARMAIVAALADTKGLAPFHDGSQFPSTMLCHICHAKGISMKRKTYELSTIYPLGSSKLSAANPLSELVDAASVYKALGEEVPHINNALRTKAEAIKYGLEAEESEFSPENAKHPRHRHFYRKVSTYYYLLLLILVDISYIYRIYEYTTTTTQVPWTLRLPGYAPISLLSDCRHANMNIGKQHVKLCVGFDMGKLSPKQLELEVKRSVYNRQALVAGPPWQMSVEEVKAAQRTIRTIRVPGWKGGKLPKIYAKKGLGYVKMDQWKQVHTHTHMHTHTYCCC
jgi:hypothetical protein